MLKRLMDDMIKREMGLFSALRRTYFYVLCDEKAEKEYVHLEKKMKHWRPEKIRESFQPKLDDKGRLAICQYGLSMPCFLEANQQTWPVRSGLCLVPERVCKSCPHRKRFKKKYFCEVFAEKSRGSTLESISNAFKKVEEILK